MAQQTTAATEALTADSPATDSPHHHRTVWGAAMALEEHEDGSAPRVGVEYRQKNGNGTSRYAGTVEQVRVDRPEGWGSEAVRPTPRITFRRDDGQRMWVEPEGLHTQGSHAPFVGDVVSLTTSTTNTVDLPEVEDGPTEDSEDAGDSSTDSVAVPDLEARARRRQTEGQTLGAAYAEALQDWVANSLEGLHPVVGTTHYSWDIPGFGKQNDPHNGFTAKDGGECVYVEVQGDRSEAQDEALARLAHRDDLEASASSRYLTLVPGQGVGQ